VGMEWTKARKRRLASSLRALKPFDPYHSALCTCGPKLTLNAYTGCGFECFYCYTSSYARGRWGRDSDRWGARADVAANLEQDIGRIAADERLACLRGMPVAVSLSSDPYPATPRVSERVLGLTRGCLARLTAAGFPVLVQTKSDLVVRDLDVLAAGRAVVGLTITTWDVALAREMEPFAPPPAARMAALAEAARSGLAALCRIDPLAPTLNDDRRGIERLAERLAGAGVRQVVSSTLKLRRDSAGRFERFFPRAAAASERLYERVEVSGYRYMTEPERRRRMERVKEIAERHGLAFSCCREGMPDLNTAACDGRGLVLRSGVEGSSPEFGQGGQIGPIGRIGRKR